jgi:hypothetical protein
MKIFKIILGLLLVVGGFIFAGYVGIWEMFIGPIIDACKAFDEGTLTALIIGKTIIKCCFASTVSALIIWLSSTLGLACISKY